MTMPLSLAASLLGTVVTILSLAYLPAAISLSASTPKNRPYPIVVDSNHRFQFHNTHRIDDDAGSPSSASSLTAVRSPTPDVGRRDALLSAAASVSSAVATLATTCPLVRSALASPPSSSPPPILPVPRLDGYDPASASTLPSAGRAYFPPLTPPLSNRATYRYELGRDAWAFEQLLVFANVSATVRSNVVRMSDGGLWVCGPQWPTGEYRALLDQLGPVRHVVLPCNALEHKAPMGAFVRAYPEASVWIAPGQYGPFGTCGTDVLEGCRMGYRVDGILPVSNLPVSSSSSSAYSSSSSRARQSTPPPAWIDEFDARTLYASLPQNAGPVSESAFFHRRTRTLITTDAVIYVPDSAPPIFSTYFKSDITSNADFWPKSVLQAVFLPLRSIAGEIRGEKNVEDEKQKWPGYGAIEGRLLRAPILRAFVDARAPNAVRDWVTAVTEMGEFDRILTAHFASPVAATPASFREAFGYLFNDDDGDGDGSNGGGADPPIACGDWSLLDSLNKFIDENKLGAPVVFDFKRGCRE